MLHTLIEGLTEYCFPNDSFLHGTLSFSDQVEQSVGMCAAC